MMALGFALVLAVLALQGPPSQPATPARVQTGEIRGRVTDAESGQPIARALVLLTRQGSSERMTPGHTDDAGLYRFTGLEAGEYDGFVEAGAFRGTHLTGSLNASGRGRGVVLREGEVRDINVALARARAIQVRVVDPWGEPLSGLRVAVTRADGRGGMSLFSWTRTTDDHGRLRLFGLDRGTYIVCAETEALGSTGSPAPGTARERLLPTCYPSANESQAEVVRLQDADLGELEIRMRHGRTFTVAGRVVDASGAPAPRAHVGFMKFRVNGSSGTFIPVDADGRFTVSNVQPGEYAIKASVGGPERPEDRWPLEVAFLPIRVDGADLEDLVVHMKRGVDVSGRVVLEDSAAVLPRPPGSGLMVMARLADDRLPGSGSTESTVMRSDQTFTLEGMFGARVLDVENVPPGWYVKSLRYGGKEIFDEPVEFKAGADAPSLEVVLSNRGATVIGRVLDDGGNPARGAWVLLVRTGGAQSHQRPVTEARVSSTGVFRAGPVRAGDYLVVALPSSAPPVWRGEWDRLARLASAAERVTLGELDERPIDLRVANVR